jgi:hypothetical protein
MFNIYPKLFSMEYGATTFFFFVTWLESRGLGSTRRSNKHLIAFFAYPQPFSLALILCFLREAKLTMRLTITT